MKGILASLLIKLGIDSKEFNSGIDGAKQKTNTFANAIKKIGGMIAGAFAVSTIINYGKRLIELSGQVEGVRSAFMKMSDVSTLNKLKDATKGTVSELDLMKRAVQAQNLGLPIKNLASLFEFATKRAQDTGQSVDYLVDSIVLGIGRKSPLILDNLGISAIALKEKLKGVGMETASVADIAKAVGEIAAESMQQSGKIIDTNAIKIQRLSASWKDFITAVSENRAVNKAGAGFLGALQSYLKIYTSSEVTWLGKLLATLDVTGNAYRALEHNIDLRAQKDKERVNQQAKNAQSEIELNKLLGISVNDLTDKEKAAAEEMGKAQMKQIEEKKKLGKTILELEEETKLLEERLKSYGVNQTAEINKTLQQIEANKKLIESLTTLKKERDLAMPGGDFMIKPITEVPKIGKNLQEMAESQDTGITTKYGGSALLGTQVSELDKLNAYAAEKLKQGNDMQKELLDERAKIFEQFKQDMAMAVADFGVNVVEEFGQSIGEMIASGNFDFSDFGKNILAGIGGFISQLGKMMIQMGIAAGAFQKLLESAFMNPVAPGLLVAAGLGLVLLGGAIQGMAKAGPNGSSSSSSVSTPSYSRAGSPSGGYRAEDNKVVFEIKGDKLVGVLSNVQRKNLNMA